MLKSEIKFQVVFLGHLAKEENIVIFQNSLSGPNNRLEKVNDRLLMTIHNKNVLVAASFIKCYVTEQLYKDPYFTCCSDGERITRCFVLH